MKTILKVILLLFTALIVQSCNKKLYDISRDGEIPNSKIIKLKNKRLVNNKKWKIIVDGKKRTFQNDFVLKRGLNNEFNAKEIGGNGYMSGTIINNKRYLDINTEEGQYKIRPLQNEEYIFIKTKDSILDEGDDVDNSKLKNIEQRSSNDYYINSNDNRISIMILYTPQAKQEIEQYYNMNSMFSYYLQQLNQSIQSANLNSDFSLVHTELYNHRSNGNTQQDINKIRNDSYVKNLRDDVSADLVLLITARKGTNNNVITGRAGHIMNSLSTNYHKTAYAVASWNYSYFNKTFSHEVGHLIGLRHDCRADNTLLPYNYSHGYYDCNLNWRTIMSYNNSDCGTQYRHNYWSNPNQNHPSHGVPMGNLSTNSCSSNNVATISSTTPYVSNFRPNDVWMKNSWDDVGHEPHTTSSYHKSPYIWIRNQRDSNLNFKFQHQNPKRNSKNYIYVKIHNGGEVDNGSLVIYRTNSRGAGSWPRAWTRVAGKNITLSANSSKIIEFEWDVQQTGHVCLIAMYNSANDPMTSQSTSVATNAKNSNNFIWKNVNIVNKSFDNSSFTSIFDIRSGNKIYFSVENYSKRKNEFKNQIESIWFETDSKFNDLLNKKKLILKGFTQENNKYFIDLDKDQYILFPETLYDDNNNVDFISLKTFFKFTDDNDRAIQSEIKFNAILLDGEKKSGGIEYIIK